MKEVSRQVIQIDSDSCQQIKPEAPQSLNPPQPNQLNQKIIVFQQENKPQKWHINSEFRQFSEFLMAMQIEQNMENHSIMTILLPQKFELNQQLWNLIQLYYQKHQLKENKIKIKKITIQGYEKSLDPISLDFLENHLKKENDQTLRSLFNLCQYLKFNHLKNLISILIASQHFFKFNENEMQKQLHQHNGYYSRQQQINLKHNLKDYAKTMSLQLLQNFRLKKEKEFKKQNQ